MQLDQCGKSGLKESIYEHFRILDRTFRCDGFHRYLLSCCCRISCVEIQTMNLIFGLEGVIRHNNKPLVNVIEFMMWLKRSKHHITIWSTKSNALDNKLDVERWLKMEQVPYDRLLFDRPEDPIFVDETPPNSKYYTHAGDNNVVAMLFEEWKESIKC